MEGFANIFSQPQAQPTQTGPASAALPGLAVDPVAGDVTNRLDQLERLLTHALGSMTAAPAPAPAPAAPVPFGVPAQTAPMPYTPPGVTPAGLSAFPQAAPQADKRPAIHATLDQLISDIPGGEALATQGHAYVDQLIASMGIDQAECLVNTLVDARKYAKLGQHDVVRSLLGQWPGGAMLAAMMSR